MASKLTEAAISSIESDTELFGRVTKELGVKPTSLPMILKRNSRRLLEFNVLNVIAKAMNKKPGEIIEHIASPKTARREIA
jgi:hypothetical protein